MVNDLTVVKANSLIEASYRLTLDEMRLLALTIGTMNPKSNQQVFEFSVSEFVRQFPDVNEDRAYSQIKSAIERIAERWVKTEDEKHVTKFRWVSSQTYFKNEGRFKIALTNEIMPYLTQLKGQFTQYQLNHISGFSSVHAIRLYELFTQYKRLGERYITVEELKKWLQLEEKYDRYNNLNQRVLTPSLAEINEKSDLYVKYEPIKRGRAIVALRFTINKKKLTDNVNSDLTKDGLTKLPQRPQVKAGSDAEWQYWRECLRIRNADYARFKADNIRRPTKLLEDLEKYYRKLGDTLRADELKEVIEKRKQNGKD